MRISVLVRPVSFKKRLRRLMQVLNGEKGGGE